MNYIAFSRSTPATTNLSNISILNRVLTGQQKEMLPGSHGLLSEYFQSCDRKQKYDKATDKLLGSNLLSRFSW